MSPSPPSPDLSVLVVAFNSRAFIGDCLASIERECINVAHEVLLMDNGTDGTAELVARDFPQVRIVQGQGNIGFARANNRLADEAAGDLLLLVNPDVILCEGAIAALLDGRERHAEAAAWSGISLDEEGRPNTLNAIPKPSLFEFATAALGKSAAGSQTIKGDHSDERVDILCGGFLLLDKQAWDEAGGFDERFFLYCEEVDLLTRLAAKGQQFWRIGAARVHHVGGHGDSLSPLRSLYRTAGTVQFLRKHWPRPKVWLAIALIWWAAFLRFSAGSLLGWSSEKLARLATGYREVALHPGLWIYGYDPERGLKAQLDRGSP